MSARLSIALRVVLPFAGGYFFSYCIRNVNAVIAPDLSADLGLAAGALGLLTSAYFFTFAAFQLPLGVLLDRFGPRRVDAVLLLIAAAGAALFSFGATTPALVAARALVGLGVSAALMASFKATTLWFAPARLPLVNGVIMSAGGLGALTATAPIEAMLGLTDWRGVFRGLALVGAGAAALVWLVVPPRPEEAHGSAEPLLAQVAGLAGVFRTRAFWRVAPVATTTQAAFMSIQGLWAGPWLADVAGLARGAVAAYLALIPMAMIAGFLVLGAVAERLARRGVPTLTVAGGALAVFLAVQGALVAGPGPLPAATWVLFGFFGTAGILYYAILSQEFPRDLAGRVNTALNVLTFGAAFACQWGLGAIIEQWPAAEPGVSRPAGYRVAFGSVLAIQVLAWVWMVLASREAGGRRSETGAGRRVR